MLKRIMMTVVVLSLVGGVVALAQNRFPDVSSDHPRSEDIEFVAGQGWFLGRANGSFSPGARITPSQMTTVLERAFPDGMSRAQFASFIRGGEWWKNHKTMAVQDWPRSTTWKGEVGPGNGRIAPGRYKITVPQNQRIIHCYWARLSNFSGELSSIIANDNEFDITSFIVDISSTDVGFELNC